MGVASSSVAVPTRTKALMVRLSPYLVEAICELTRAIKDKTHAQTEITGLLFGKSQDGTVTVEALKTFRDSSGPRSDLARRERMEKAFTAAMTLANEDPEFSSYKLLGWFSLRGGGGLINADVEFHNRHFKTTDEIALIVWREGDTQITTEIYGAVEAGKLTTEDYRWSSVRLSTELRHVSQPVDLVMRVRMNDDLYMRTYGVSDGRERKEEWKKIADSAKRTLLSFLPGRGPAESIYSDELPLPEATGTATRSFESRTLFRGTEREPSSVALPAAAEIPALRTEESPTKAAASASAAAAPAPAPVAPMVPSSPAPAAPGTVPSTTAAPGIVTRVKEQPPAETMTAPRETGTKTREMEPSVPSFDFNRAPRPKPPGLQEVTGLPMVIPKNRPVPKSAGFPWLALAVSFVLFSILSFGFFYLKGTDGGENKLGQIMRVLFPGSDLNLHAESHGDSLWLSWNKRNPSVASSIGAKLTVNDGPRHFERRLDPSQVADGEVKYTPVSGDVTFQLQVYGTDQSTALGSLRVVDATTPLASNSKAPLDISEGTGLPPQTPIAPPAVTRTETPALGNQAPGTQDHSLDTAANKGKDVPVTAPAILPPSNGSNNNQSAQQGNGSAKPTGSATPAQQPPAPQPVQPQPTQPPPQAVTPNPNPPATNAAAPPPTAPKPVAPTTAPRSTTTYQTGNSSIAGWNPENKPAAPPAAANPSTESKPADFVGPKALLQVLPNTRSLTPGSITEPTRVEVQVSVDTTGHVRGARLTTPNVKSQVAAAAVNAAKQWTFQPATLKGNKVDSDHMIVFEFKPEAQ